MTLTRLTSSIALLSSLALTVSGQYYNSSSIVPTYTIPTKFSSPATLSYSTTPSATPDIIGWFDGTHFNWNLPVSNGFTPDPRYPAFASLGSNKPAGLSFESVNATLDGVSVPDFIDFDSTFFSVNPTAALGDNQQLTISVRASIDASSSIQSSYTASFVYLFGMSAGLARRDLTDVLITDEYAQRTFTSTVSTLNDTSVSPSSDATSTDATTSDATASDDSTLVSSVVTSTIDGVVTSYTTWCPLSSTSSTESLVASVVTSTIDGDVTSYITYCPLSSEESAAASAGPATSIITVTCTEEVCQQTSTSTNAAGAETTIYYSTIVVTLTASSAVPYSGATSANSDAVAVTTAPATSEVDTTETVVTKVTKTIAGQSSASAPSNGSSAASVNNFEGAANAIHVGALAAVPAVLFMLF